MTATATDTTAPALPRFASLFGNGADKTGRAIQPGQPTLTQAQIELENEVEAFIQANAEKVTSTPKTAQGRETLLLEFKPARLLADFISKENPAASDYKALGLAWSKDRSTGDWSTVWWHRLPEHRQAGSAAIVEASNAQAPAAAQADLPPVPVPDGVELMPYQVAGVHGLQRIFGRYSGAMLADDMGLGKTPQGIAFVNATPDIRRVLIVCPSLVKINWSREWQKFSTRPDLTVAIQNAGKTWVGDAASVVIINYDILKKYEQDLGAATWDLVVADESHYVKNAKAARSKALFAIPTKRRLALSGTPVVNRPSEFQPVLAWLDRPTWGNWRNFVTRYCAAFVNKWGGWDVSGASNCEELQHRLRGSIMIRREKADVLVDLPPKRRSLVSLPAPKAVVEASRALCSGIQADLPALFTADINTLAEAEAATQRLETVTKVNFDEMARFWALCGREKKEAAVEWIKDQLDGGVEKIVVFSHHVELIKHIQESLQEYGAVSHFGELSQDEKQRSVDRFQNDKNCRVFSGSTLASVEGITLTAASTVAFMEGDWRPGKLSQGEDRCWRYGQKNAVSVYHLVFADTLDAMQTLSTVKKQGILEKLTTAEKAADWAATTTNATN